MIARKVVFCVTWSILSIVGLVLYLGMKSTFIGYFWDFILLKICWLFAFSKFFIYHSFVKKVGGKR